ncbi:MAG: histidinol dehydrogenase [Chthoniobacterales bacterium]|nr:histidinol dehydrogenase [Chthoniobacterales bacterium]
MKILRPSDRDYDKALASLDRRAAPDPKVRTLVTKILTAVEKKGDAALLRYTKKFGGPSLAVSQIPVAPAETARAIAELPPDTRRAISAARANVRNFARRSLRKSWFMKNRQGAVVGERFDPFQRVGIYIPGGNAPLVSSAIMTCTLAAAAGVREIVTVTPSGKDGQVHPALLAALAECGATEIYRVGGAQAVAALAYGTKTIRPVQKIFGPGNAWVVEAKRQVFGRVAVDLLPGPSEILVIADKTANPAWIAADLLAQSEHGHGSAAILLTDSPKILSGVEKLLSKQIKLSKRPKELSAALKNAALVLVRDMDSAIRIANDYAAEHVSIATSRPGEIALQLVTTGGIFLGGISPVAGGDFLAGPSHELPTGGAGKSFAGLTVDQFQRRTSVVMFDEPSLRASLPYLKTFSEIESLDAHGRSARIRLEK